MLENLLLVYLFKVITSQRLHLSLLWVAGFTKVVGLSRMPQETQTTAMTANVNWKSVALRKVLRVTETWFFCTERSSRFSELSDISCGYTVPRCVVLKSTQWPFLRETINTSFGIIDGWAVFQGWHARLYFSFLKLEAKHAAGNSAETGRCFILNR